jgi:hypothetical protein
MMSKCKTGRPLNENRANTIEAKKPWLKLEMSRRTWYRRQAEKRKGRTSRGFSSEGSTDEISSR